MPECEIRRRMEIVNRLGLHARAAAKLVQTASRFASEITLRCNGREANAKSIMGVMMLAAAQGTMVELEARGPDAAAAADAIETLVRERFGEER
ncbi:HPr family phosphocarrier protein [Inmirania thermothiophila]|uniref:Phosphocarrier protein n=1 Tax=Inmirania thermothiophila TaxID=1750597 RepID=A0A3N1XX12_9GAMM|nr:HPr family phosphocarrier protein [Inmirania thermothiophila]ROR29752.1 phosphocarrier protein [Inmirania thermothiophila]